MRYNFIFTSILFLTIFGLWSCNTPRQFEQDTSKSAFRYREVYMPEGLGMKGDSLGLNTVDRDWAIWGHNLSKMLPEKTSESIYAKQNGATLRKQFCFTSPRLFEYISEYIDDQYSSKDKARFAILPNDNDIVCLCERCVAIGNTKEDASPALFPLIRKLAEKYPNHIFYTSDYRTTKGLPTDTMPGNTGVMVSAIDYPLTYGENSKEEAFLNLLDQWGEKTKRILIWDYINNFDDYFTPFPVAGVMQKRLQNYKNHNATAIFLNGSGEDPSSLSRLKTEVLAGLTANPDLDWRAFLLKKAKELYPVSGETIAGFMLAQEDFIKENSAILPLYEGVAVARKRYLPEDQFIAFHDTLMVLHEKANGEEKNFLNELLTEFALTRLELNRLNGKLEDSERFLSMLESDDISQLNSYNESGWLVDSYVRDYRNILDHARESSPLNKLKGVKLTPLTPLDEDYSDITIITDGLLGMPSNYHNGHLITSPESSTSISIPRLPDTNKLRVWLSYNTGYKIHLPERVTLSAPGMDPVTKEANYPRDLSGHCMIEFDLPENVTGNFTLTLTKNPETRSMAVEEIELL